MIMFSSLDSKKVFEFFKAISNVPRESKKEEKISKYLREFAIQRNLEVFQDDWLNIIIKKPATKMFKDSPTIILQSHMDIVGEKLPTSKHNFDTDPIEWIIKDDYIYANDTTLGADNGIGVAYSLALLDSDDIEHPALEVIFTVDEETGMTGAHQIDTSDFDGKIFINIDSEEEGLFFLSCAGGTEATITIDTPRIERRGLLVNIKINGLLGGHSGMEIHNDRANANKLMARVLDELTDVEIPYNIVSINGGSKVNAIPRESLSSIIIAKDDYDKVEMIIKKLKSVFKDEYTPQDEGVTINVYKEDVANYQVMNNDLTRKVVNTLLLIPNGVFCYNKYLDDLVQTSSNLGVLKTEEDKVILISGIRSSIDSQKLAVLAQMKALAEAIGANIKSGSCYPAWEYNNESRIKDVFLKCYKDLFDDYGKAVAIHAGLECGLFKEKMPDDVEFISFGPNMYDVHTAHEHVSISSIDRNWKLLKKVLESLKNY